ncbi:ATP-grasp domain-containing protein [Nocardioides carbamazepini]|uniref:acetyl-CoA carboxylase biotin carboxylase subunit n=1 Tax=Nocardioides carbamazepini TaxID=2854259 RepID=UPI002149DACA|nr:biotin carboxylase N-terminal domain-containing protein [Nocardioides carbamazepini]MCR1783686.1 ATP-grasp domain-containing protein [Nocardioides carbamazepini]
MRRVLVANRGEIAVRVVRACFDEGLESVVAVSEVDRDSLAARMADGVVQIGPAAAAESYLRVERIVAAALHAGCDAVHPGYGFLSERPELAEACAENGLVFVGPPGDVMRRSGDKLRAREVADKLGIPTGGGTPGLHSLHEALEAAERLDAYPLLMKASAGGGGRGMTIVRGPEDLRRAFERSRLEAERAFGDGTLYLERFIERARHVEVQVLADAHGSVRHLGERDCSAQRRYQKLIEEAPAVGLADETVAGLRESAVRLAEELGYVGAGTIEFLVDAQRGDFIFLELNARVQVEHPVTEEVTGIDIVREQLRIAAGRPISFAQEDVTISGHAVECRINAEDPGRDFLPSPGRVDVWVAPQGHGIRVDTFLQPGAVVQPHYDSMVAKVITHAASRTEALALMDRALARLRVEGIRTTTDLQRAIVSDERYRSEPIHTRWLEDVFLPGNLHEGQA